MTQLAHPSSFLPEGIAGTLRSRSAEAEAGRDLHPDQLALIYAQQWFRMLLPGHPLPLPELVRLEEGISWADGSVGWTVTLCSGAGWFAGFFPSGMHAAVFDDKRLCIAGSGGASGEAHRTHNGYRIDGRWDYASGALHATAFTANCVIMDKGQKVLTEAGHPLIRPFLFLKDEVTIDKSWNTIGLIATGSHSFEVKDVDVPENRCFTIEPSEAKADHPIYRYPFLQLAEATLTANLSGMGMHFLDCCADLFKERIEKRRFPVSAAEEMNAALDEARGMVAIQRAAFYTAVDRSWEGVDTGAHDAELSAVSHTSRQLVAAIRHAVDRLYPYGGLGAARPDTEINRVWRDLHTASQHNLLSFLHN